MTNAQRESSFAALSSMDSTEIYRWNSFSIAIIQGLAPLAEIERIEALVPKVMPPQWKPDLDQRVAAHLKKFNETQDAPL